MGVWIAMALPLCQKRVQHSRVQLMVTGAHGASTLCVQLRVGLLESKHALEGVLIPQQVMAANSAPEMHKRKQYAGELPAQLMECFQTGLRGLRVATIVLVFSTKTVVVQIQPPQMAATLVLVLLVKCESAEKMRFHAIMYHGKRIKKLLPSTLK